MFDQGNIEDLEGPRRQPVTGSCLLAATFDLLTVGVVITDADGEILYCNAAAADMISAGDPINRQNARLCAATPGATKALASLVATAASGGAPIDEAELHVPLPSGSGAASIAYARVLKAYPDAEVEPGALAVAVFIRRACTEPPPLAAIAQHYSLTSAQARVLEAIVSGKNRKETAAALGCADSTVKTHLAGLYAKTGTSDQIGLFRLVAILSWHDI